MALLVLYRLCKTHMVLWLNVQPLFFLLRRILRLPDEKRRGYENALWACVKNLLSGVNVCFSTCCACAAHFAVKLSGWDELEVGISLPRGRISSLI